MAKKKKTKNAMAKQGRYVLVVHMSKAAQKAMDRKRGKASRSEFARAGLAKLIGKVALE